MSNLPPDVPGSSGGGLVSVSVTALTSSGIFARVRGAAASPPSVVMLSGTQVDKGTT